MKRVVNSNQVTHLWAHKLQSDARNAKSSIFFEGDTIYSYGRHFPIARFVQNVKGENAILFTTRDYSVTTSGHKSQVRSAIPSNIPVFYVDSPEKTPSISDVMVKEKEGAELLVKAKRARKTNKAFYLSQANGCIESARQFAEFFGLDYKVPTPEMLQNEVEAIENGRKQERERQKLAEQKRIQDAQASIEKWKKGEISYIGNLYSLKTAFARIQDGELVTSKGARVPLEHVKKVAPLVRSLITEGKTYKRNGHTIHLGNYALDEISADGNLRAGCHLFEKSEVLRILDLVEKA